MGGARPAFLRAPMAQLGKSALPCRLGRFHRRSKNGGSIGITPIPRRKLGAAMSTIGSSREQTGLHGICPHAGRGFAAVGVVTQREQQGQVSAGPGADIQKPGNPWERRR